MAAELIGRYEIIEELGRSPMTVVYRAFDTQANREVVIKMFLLEQAINVEAKLSLKAHFRRELNIIASLEHPAIVPVYDVGEHDGQPYYVMRYMAGGSLNQKLATTRRFSLEETAHIIDRLAPALDHAHKQNVIHRDIKPDNILFDLDDHPYISDFGVAKPAEAEDAARMEGPVGTPEYMSPEQENQELVDERSDVYSLGIVIYQMLTGKTPDESGENILNEVPELPTEMNEILKISLAMDKRDRYVTVLHLSRALHRATFGDESISTTFDRHGERAAMRSIILWIAGSVALLGAFLWVFTKTGNVPFLAPAPTATPTLIPANPTLSLESETLVPDSTIIDTNLTPTNLPPGSADQIALVSGNGLYLMNMDGSGLTQVRSENSSKSNLQWIGGNQLTYISRNCVYLLHGDTRQTDRLSCFPKEETLEGFNVFPDSSYAAVVVQRTLNIVPFDVEFLKTVTSRFELFNTTPNCFYTQFAFQEVRWGKDTTGMIAHVISPRFVNSDQLFLLNLDIENCSNVELSRLDIIPGTRLQFESESSRKIVSYDWDGSSKVLFNDSIRNDGFGNLYLYDAKTQEITKLNPIGGLCCYRDPHWSPDGNYFIFAYQRFDRSEISIYYIPLGEALSGGQFTPISLPSGFFATAREKPQPVLRYAE